MYLDQFGPATPPDAAPQAAPAAQAAPINQPAAAPTGNQYLDNYGEAEPPPQAPPPAAPPPSKAHVASMAVANAVDKFAAGGGKIAGGFAVLADKLHGAFTGKDETGIQDSWFSHVVDPYVQQQAVNTLGPDATTGDKALYGVSNMAASIASYFLGGPIAGEAEAGSALAAHLLGGGAASVAPAFTDAIDVGQGVLDATGNKAAAAKAGAMSYLATTAGALVPAGVGKGLATKVATGAAVGAGLTEAQRQAQNSVMPADQQQPFDALNETIGTVAGGMFGAAVHAEGALAGRRGVVEAPHNVMEEMQKHAAEVVAAQGGDSLDQTVAATNVNAHLGAVHDAAAVQGAREAAQTSMQMRRAQEMADEQAQIDQGAREQALNQAEKTKAPETTPDQGFEQAEADQASQKDKDYTAAKNQVGDQTVEAAAGAEKGGANEPAPTLADALPPEQVEALQKLKAQRAEELAAPPEKTVQESMREQAKGTEDDFRELPQEAQAAPETEAPPKAAPGENAAPEAPGEDENEAPEGNPPPQTPQTLAERRQAALDTQMAEKAGVKPNRLQAIREAAEKRAVVDKPASLAERRNSFGDMAKDLNTRLAMSHDEAKEHLSGVSSEVGKGFQVHASNTADTIPAKLRAQLEAHHAAGGGNVKGAYEDGVAHVFADSHQSGDKEDLLNTAVHELTHKGLSSFLGNDYSRTMESVGHDIKNTKWAKDYAARRGWDTKDPHYVAELANEYAAHMAENHAAGREVHAGLPVTDKSPGHFQKVWDGIRSGLRSLGLVRHWNDNDIAALIRQAQAHTSGVDPLRAARDGAAYKNSGGARFSLDNDDDYMEDHYPPDHPLAVGHKFGRTMEEQANYNPGFVKSVKGWTSDFRDNAPRKVLGAIGLRNLPDFMSEGKMPSLHGFIDAHDAMEGRKGQINAKDNALATEWSKWQAGQDDRGAHLNDIMHASTLSGLDPSKPYAEKYTAAERAGSKDNAREEISRRAQYNKLKEHYGQLDEQGKSLYNRVRDSYSDKRVQTLDALEKRIQETGADDQTKKNLMAQMRKSFEGGTVKGPYFPLQRFGDHWASAKDENGNTKAFARFESGTQQKAWQAEMRKQGLDVDGGRRMETNSQMERIDPNFVKNVMEHAQAADPSGGLAKDIWQEYLRAMPEMSMRKHLISRVGRLGFSGDALRAFSYNSFHGAHQLARLEYGNKLQDKLAGAENEARALEQNAAQNPGDANAQSDARWAPALAQELKDRMDWINNPRASKLASTLTKFGFNYYLGAAPATSFRILSQNPMLAAPMLAKHFNWLGATKELSRATGEWVKSYGSLGDTLRGDERKAFDEASDMGVFQNTNTQSLATGGQGGPIGHGPKDKLMKAAGFLFNAAEHHNRMTTLLAAYRLGRSNEMSHADASKLARQITWDSHFDYTNANRPRYLQNDTAKVIGLFKQYSLGVTYRLAREFRDSLSSEKDPQERMAAMKTFAGLIGSMGMFAGVTGMPLYWIAEKVVNTVFGSEDQPFDMTAALHKHLNDALGETAGDSIMTGPIGAASGASLSGGASYNDLWYRPPSQEETTSQQMSDALGQLMGPIAAIPLNAATGADMIHKGNVSRGLEHFLPPEAASLAKTVRYATQGVNNMSNEPVVPKDQITNKDLFLQSVGFTPQKVADAYARNTAVKNLDKQIVDRKSLLSSQYELAALNDDQKEMASVMQKIEAFNSANPGMAIGKGLEAGVMAKARRGATAQAGVNVAKGNEHLEDEY